MTYGNSQATSCTACGNGNPTRERVRATPTAIQSRSPHSKLAQKKSNIPKVSRFPTATAYWLQSADQFLRPETTMQSNRATIYSNGIADFQRVYKVTGDSTKISIPVRQKHLGDVLASLTISGDVKIVSPPSYQPANLDDGNLSLIHI